MKKESYIFTQLCQFSPNIILIKGIIRNDNLQIDSCETLKLFYRTLVMSNPFG